MDRQAVNSSDAYMIKTYLDVKREDKKNYNVKTHDHAANLACEPDSNIKNSRGQFLVLFTFTIFRARRISPSLR